MLQKLHFEVFSKQRGPSKFGLESRPISITCWQLPSLTALQKLLRRTPWDCAGSKFVLLDKANVPFRLHRCNGNITLQSSRPQTTRMTHMMYNMHDTSRVVDQFTIANQHAVDCFSYPG